MRRVKAETRVRRHAGGGPGLTGLALGLLSLGLFLGVVGQLGLLLGGLEFQSSREFLGRIRPTDGPSVVSLPADAPLERMHVQYGDRVYQGETVATLDTAVLDSTVYAVDLRLLADRFERQCLLSGSIPEAQLLAALDEDARAAADLALARCAAIGTDDVDMAARLTARAARKLGERARLTAHRDRMAKAAGVTPAGRATVDLFLDVASILLEREHADLLDRRAVHLAAAAAQTLARANALDAEILLLQTRLDRLEALRKAPRLLAPESGTIGRMRPVPAGQMAHDDVEIVEITPERQQIFEVQFLVPTSGADRLRPGQMVTFRLLGDIDAGRSFAGQVAGLSPAPGGDVAVQVTPTAESLAVLSDPDNRLALRGPDTASMIRVGMGTRNLGAALVGEMRRLIPGAFRL